MRSLFSDQCFFRCTGSELEFENSGILREIKLVVNGKVRLEAWIY